MTEVIVQMAGLILCGVVWRLARPSGLAPEQTRRVLTSLVYYLLLPALVLSVLWQADLGGHSMLIALCAAFAVLAGMLLAVLSCRLCRAAPPAAGAAILAASFPNATYLGLPVLEATFGPAGRSVAIQYDLFACTPLLFTAGVLVAARYGEGGTRAAAALRELARIPAIWAALVAVALNLLDVPLPSVVDGWLGLLERGVVPLMLISLGLSLDWSRARWEVLPAITPVLLIRHLAVPAVVVVFAHAVGMRGELHAAVVMESAMPSMVLGIVFCDRYNLDVGLYAAAVTVSTALSLVTLPAWYAWLLG